MSEFTTLKSDVFPHELFIDRSKLETHGIKCFAQDEHTIQVNNFYSEALGGIRLKVRENDLERAIEILANKPDISVDYKEKGIECSNCGSTNTGKIKLNGVRSLVFVMLFALPIPFFSKKIQCYDCHSIFYSEDK